MRRASFSTSSITKGKVAVLGAAGGIGQPLSLLLKLSPEVDHLSLYDIVGTPGVAADLSHVSRIDQLLLVFHEIVSCSYLLTSRASIQIPTKAPLVGALPSPGKWPPSHNEGLEEALMGADVVVIPAGVPRKPGMTRDDLFNTNAVRHILS